MRLRQTAASDWAFLVEMSRLACGLDDRPLPEADDPAVVALLPASPEAAIVAADDAGNAVGAAWWHFHDPPLVPGDDGEAPPELVIAVTEAARGRGIGTALIEALATQAAKHFDALTVNVHLRNPAIPLYIRTGFRVAGQGRGWYGVAMRRSLR